MPTFLLPVKLCSDYDFKDVTFQKKKKPKHQKNPNQKQKPQGFALHQQKLLC